MNGSIAQAAALAIVGNQRVAGADVREFWPEATAFRYCKSVKFICRAHDASESEQTLFAADPDQWLLKLISEGIIGFRLHHVVEQEDDRMLAGFVGGGGRWFIEAVRTTGSDLWEAVWQVGNQTDPDRNIWDVTYYKVVAGGRSWPRPDKLVALHRELLDALRDAEKFAREQKVMTFAEYFRTGTELLRSPSPLAQTYHSDLIKNGSLPLQAVQILAAAQPSWVFGGMGSWNDLGFEGDNQGRYIEISERLFSVLNEAICEAASSGFHAAK